MKVLSGFALLLAALIVVEPRLAAAQGPPQLSKKDKLAAEEIRRLNTEEVEAFIKNDPKAMQRLWSDEFVVTNPLNEFVNKQQVLGMVKSGFLQIISFDRQTEYLRVYG